jgi:hypothetical protein
MRLALPLVLLLSGCLATTPASSPTHPPLPPADGGRLVVTPLGARVLFHVEGRMGAEAASKIAGFVNPATSNATLPFQVHAGAVAVVAELAWLDPASDLDLQLFSPAFCPDVKDPSCFVRGYFGDAAGTGTWRNEAGEVGAGDSPARLRLGPAELASVPCSTEACGWQLAAWAKATPGTTFELHVTVFYGEAPAQDYTAIPALP